MRKGQRLELHLTLRLLGLLLHQLLALLLESACKAVPPPHKESLIEILEQILNASNFGPYAPK